MKNRNLKDLNKRKMLKKFELILLQKKVSKIINRNFLEKFQYIFCSNYVLCC